jgi:hypothetical protein
MRYRTDLVFDNVRWHLKAGLRIRINFIRIRIQHLRIQGFDDQKLNFFFFLIKNCNLPIPRPP